jgi:hypothetical protein
MKFHLEPIVRNVVSAEVKVMDTEKHPGADTRVQVHGRVIPFGQVLKVDKCPFSENFLKGDLIEPGSKIRVQL